MNMQAVQPEHTQSQTLTERQKTEAAYHDMWAESIDFSEIDPDVTFEAITAQESRYILSRMGSLVGKRVLDLGCGSGESAVYFAKKGAQVWACDISAKSVEITQKLAAHHGVTVDATVSAAEHLPYPDQTFDFVFANGVLHHVDIPPTLQEIKRILKPGGEGFFIEPLPYNPVINVYRVLASAVRTPDEKPLDSKDVAQIRAVFPSVEIRGFWLFTLGLFLYFFLIERVHPGKVRYWKKVLYDADNYRGLFGFLKKLDDWTLPRLPFLSALCWNMVIGVRRDK